MPDHNLRILFDYSNLACRSVYAGRDFAGTEREWREITHSIFSQIHEFVTDVAQIMDEGERVDVILARDWRQGYWRQDFYPQYKAGRAERRSESEIDWERAYVEFDRLADLLDETTPWKSVQVARCEADDVIFALSSFTDLPVIIYSGDSDYLQLVSDRVSLYVPHRQDYAEFPCVCKIGGGEAYCRNAGDYLKYAILTGQAGKDNVYNVKTPSDWEARNPGKRKPGFGVAAARKILEAGNVQMALLRLGYWENYLRNEKLIDMRMLPLNLRLEILGIFDAKGDTPPDLQRLAKEYDWPGFERDMERIASEMSLLLGDVPETAECETVDFDL